MGQHRREPPCLVQLVDSFWELEEPTAGRSSAATVLKSHGRSAMTTLSRHALPRMTWQSSSPRTSSSLFCAPLVEKDMKSTALLTSMPVVHAAGST